MGNGILSNMLFFGERALGDRKRASFGLQIFDSFFLTIFNLKKFPTY